MYKRLFIKIHKFLKQKLGAVFAFGTSKHGAHFLNVAIEFRCLSGVSWLTQELISGTESKNSCAEFIEKKRFIEKGEFY
uniref:Uncharacterized LOC104266634 n=1 Tax=Ciona intestinalis TaxID=7719 RepID=H2XUC9_CIOIN